MSRIYLTPIVNEGRYNLKEDKKLKIDWDFVPLPRSLEPLREINNKNYKTLIEIGQRLISQSNQTKPISDEPF